MSDRAKIRTLNGVIKVAGLGLLPGAAGRITLAEPSLLHFVLWPTAFAHCGFSEKGCPLAPQIPSGTRK